MGSRAKRLADDKRITERFFQSAGVEPCKVCGWPAKVKVGDAWYCREHVPQEPESANSQ